MLTSNIGGGKLMRDVVVIDVSAVLYSGLTGNIGNFMYKGIPTGGLYQLGMQVAQALTFGRFLIMVWDSRTDRRDLIPTYKAGRSPNPKIEFWKNISYRYLHNVVENSFKVEGFEADDLAAELLDIYTNERSYDLITSDYDWAYNIKDYKTRITPVNTNLPLINHINFSKILDKANTGNLVFNTICMYKVLYGDTSDHIEPFVNSKFSNETIYKLFINFCVENNLDIRIKPSAQQFALTYRNLFSESSYKDFKNRIDVVYPRRQIELGNPNLTLKAQNVNYTDLKLFCNLIGSKKILRAIDEEFVEDLGSIHNELRIEWEATNNSYINQTHLFDNNDIQFNLPDRGGFVMK